MLPFQPSPHESVIESEHEAVAGADTEPENGEPPDATNEPSHEIDHPTSPGYMPPPTVIVEVIEGGDGGGGDRRGGEGEGGGGMELPP